LERLEYSKFDRRLRPPVSAHRRRSIPPARRAHAATVVQTSVAVYPANDLPDRFGVLIAMLSRPNAESRVGSTNRLGRLGKLAMALQVWAAAILLVVLSAGLIDTPAHAQRCRPGYGLCASGGCAPLGSVCCRGGGYCRSGQICIKNGTACLNRSSDRVCGNGAYCNPGYHCGRNGRCYSNAPARAPVAKLLPLDVSPPPAPQALAPPPAPPPQSRALPNIAGLYTVAGTLVSGQRYTGQVTIRGGADNVKLEWRLTNGQTYAGQGSMKGDVLTIDWGDTYPVIYRYEPATGVLRGTWANGRATDVLTPAR
jgi:hypothetical protein